MLLIYCLHCSMRDNVTVKDMQKLKYVVIQYDLQTTTTIRICRILNREKTAVNSPAIR